MNAIGYYSSPIGSILLSADEIGLTGLWFAGQKNLPQLRGLKTETPQILSAKKWLDIYFTGKEPDFTPPLHPMGTPFQMEVWKILCTTAYGHSTTYGEIARRIAVQRRLPRMSAQAVGGAVGRNKISIIIPCHRVIGSDGSLIGYAGGLDKKIKLLQLEQIPFFKK